MSRLHLIPGVLVALEGLDQSGKSTQAGRLARRLSGGLFTHQPSGGGALGRAVYEFTERNEIVSPMARQFLHLASQAEHYETQILPALATGAVVLDRCWWSTVAYGWFGSPLREHMTLDDFLALSQIPSRGRLPDLVLVFASPWKPDAHNSAAVREGYERLTDLYPREALKVPVAPPDEVTDWILAVLTSRGLAHHRP